jgi:hypothetical protein
MHDFDRKKNDSSNDTENDAEMKKIRASLTGKYTITRLK